MTGAVTSAFRKAKAESFFSHNPDFYFSLGTSSISLAATPEIAFAFFSFS